MCAPVVKIMATFSTNNEEEDNNEDNIALQRFFTHHRNRYNSLLQQIHHLRRLCMSMDQDQLLLHHPSPAHHAICRRKLVSAQQELQHTRGRLKNTENEAATLLEAKQLEMDRLQRERDDTEAQMEHLRAECTFFRGYTRYLEEKVSVLVEKLHHYHRDLQKKTEEVVEIRGRAVEELEWVKQSMINFEKNLLEFHNTNAQLSSEKEHLMRELQGLKQLENPKDSAGKSSEELMGAEKNLECANQIIQGLQERLQQLDSDLNFANRRAESTASQLSEADATISELQGKFCRVQDELQAVKEKNVQYVTEKIEADAGAQLREAAISVLRLRIYALEGDLQKERDMSSSKCPGSTLTTLTQLSPEMDVENISRPAMIDKILKRDRGNDSEYAAAKLEAAKYQLQDDAETIKKLREVNALLETDLERARGLLCHGFGSDAWSIKKMKKLEQALAEAHERYMLLHKEMNNLRTKKAAIHSFENSRMGECDKSEQAHEACLQQYPFWSAEDGSASEETSEITHQFSGKVDSHYSSSNSHELGDLITGDEDGHSLQKDSDHAEVLIENGRRSANISQIEHNCDTSVKRPVKSRLSSQSDECLDCCSSFNKIYR